MLCCHVVVFLFAEGSFTVMLTGPVGNIAEPANGGTASAVVTGTVTALPAGGLGVDVVITLTSTDGTKTGIWSLTVCFSIINKHVVATLVVWVCT